METFFNSLHLMPVKKRWIWTGRIAIAVFALMQLTNLGRTTHLVVPGHDLNSTNAPPPEIAGMLRGACYDCHSYETHWPWYGYVAPVSWWLDSHVNDARGALNFSEWPHGDPQKEGKKWSRVSDAVSDGSMPLPSYARMHKAARLTDAQRQQLADWADKEAEQLKAAK
jgi:hypothetical protein